MADKRISEMPPLSQSDVVASVDYLPIVDASEPDASLRNKRILAQSITLGSLAQTSSFVGIGTSSPVAKLDVVGEIRTTQSFNAGNAKYLAFSTSAPSATNFSLYGDTTQTIINAPSGGIIRASVNSIPQFQISETASAVNFLQVAGAAAGKVPVLSSQGSDTNTGVVLQSKGTGAIDLAAGSSGINVSNGTTVTALTLTAVGSSYTSAPSVVISAPTTSGGVQATATIPIMVSTYTIASGGTGYTVNDVLTVSGGTSTSACVLTVTSVSGGVITGVSTSGASRGAYTVAPSSPVSVTGGTGSGATFNLTFSVANNTSFTITNAGSGYVERPTVTFSGGGGSGAAAYATIGGTTSIKWIGNTINFSGPNGGIGLQLYDSQGTSGVDGQYWRFAQNFSGTFATMLASSGGQISSSGATQLSFYTNTLAQEQFRIAHTASAVNYVQATGSATSNRPSISVGGSDTNIGLDLISKGATGIFMYANGGSNVLMTFAHSTSGVNYFQANNAAAGSAPSLQATGSDTNVGLNLQTKGTGTINFQTAGSTTQFAVTNTASAVNYFQATGAVAGNQPVLSAQGSDSNVSMALQSKGTGGVDLAAGSTGVNISNGTTVTAITRTAAGTGYTSPPTWTAAASQTGGTQASGSVNSIGVVSATVSAGGTGYTVGDVLTVSGGTQTTAATLTVATLSGSAVATVTISNAGVYTASPANPASVTGGTGSGATFTLSFGINASFTITQAGTGYVEQPTITFSGGGGSGATAYATVGGTSIIRTVAGALAFYSPSGPVAQFVASSGTAVNQVNFVGAVTGGAPAVYSSGSDPNIGINYSSKSTGSNNFYTNTFGQLQLQVSHTASAVNYVQVTGAATTAAPTISVQGSDTNAGLNVAAKGTGSILLRTAGTVTQFAVANTASAANYLQATGAAASSSPSMSAQGSDTNIDLILTPKGTGVIQFGTHTGTTDTAISGYITIKDSGGTTRKLAVIT